MAKHIIIVEDEPNIANALKFILERDGYDVTCVPDGGEAVFEIQNRRPQLIVLDVMLPNRTGIEILRDVRASGTIAKTPVLMLSAKGQAKDKELALETGADVYMVKPFSNSEVLAQVKALLA